MYFKMKDFLRQTFKRLLSLTSLEFKRSLYDQFEISRLTGLIGPRGVGKTTLMLQYIKENLASSNQAFYFSADAVYFQKNTLLEFVNDLYNVDGIRYFFIDEIHKYDNWNQELKNIYDAFPDIKMVYSGSSMLEILKGSHDLSRRARIFHLPGMSFREYLSYYDKSNIESVGLSTLLDNPQQLDELGNFPKLMGYFKDYLAHGYYPFVFEETHTYYERVLRIIDKVLFEDIPNYFELKTQNLHVFKKILSYLATIPPGELNTNNIAKNMNMSHQTVYGYLEILEAVGLIQMMYPYEGGNQYLRKPQKIFLHNTTLFHAFQTIVGQPLDVGNLRELYFVQALRDAGEKVYYSKKADFRTKTHVFEVGGKNKTMKQIANSPLPSFLVKDEILHASAHVLPLVFLGFIS